MELQDIEKILSFILEFASILFGEHTSGERSKECIDNICAWRVAKKMRRLLVI